MELIDERLRAIFVSVFELPDSADVQRCDRTNTATWDSMAHVTLIFAIEEEFGLNLDPADSMQITSFDSACRYVAALQT